MAKALITERFVSYQGTGHLVGKRQAFVRFAGCNVSCPIRSVCDEPDSLHQDNSCSVDPAELAQWALDKVGPFGWLAITGGEPCEQPEALTQLGIEAESRGLRIHLQTSGTIPVPIRTDWLTVSPKTTAHHLRFNRQQWAQEIVLVYDPAWIKDIQTIKAFRLNTRCYDYYLQPLTLPDGTTNIEETLTMLDALNRQGCPWDLTLQAHKFIGVK